MARVSARAWAAASSCYSTSQLSSERELLGVSLLGVSMSCCKLMCMWYGVQHVICGRRQKVRW